MTTPTRRATSRPSAAKATDSSAPAPSARRPRRAPGAGGQPRRWSGAEQDLAKLHAGLGAGDRPATRTIVFVTGEAGIGKTTLLDRFVDEVERAGGVRVARGQCLEQYGEGEAYLPVLEALGRLARDDGGRRARRNARGGTRRPGSRSWRRSIRTAPARSRRGGAIATMPARMLREMADALEVFTRRRALVLVLEDLQWSDRVHRRPDRMHRPAARNRRGCW